jgi:soluble lytic murein transglycosylase-like protein
MANVSDKEIKKLKSQLDEFNKKRDPKALERRIKAETQGKSGIEAFQIENQIREEWRLATQKTTAFMSGFFEGLVGKDLGSVLSKRYAKADTQKVEQAQSNFLRYFDKSAKETNKKAEVSVKKTVSLNKDIKIIKTNILNIQKSVQTIQKSLTGKSTPQIKSGYRFDPRMAGGGRYINEATSKIVSKREAIAAGRTEALTRAIAADEDPMIRLVDTVESILKGLGKDNKSIHQRLNDIENKLDSIDSGDSSGLLDNILDRTPRRTTKRTPKKPDRPGRFDRLKRFGRVGRFATIGAAATGAAAITAAGAYALDRGMTAIGEEAKGKMNVLESEYGIRTLYNSKGFATGYEINGKRYTLDNLPAEYKDLIEAYGPGDKRSASARAAIARIKANPGKYNALRLNASRPKTVTPKVTPTPPAPTPAPAPSAGPISRAVAAAKQTVQRAVGAGGQATMATGAAVAAGGGAVAAGVKTSVDKVKDIIVGAAKKVGVNPGIMLAMGQQESSFNPSAQPYDKKTGKLLSSAKGIFQFINSTWDAMVKKYSGAYPELLKGAFDPVANAIAGALYVKENSQYLQKKGIPVDGTSIYATHFLGPGGAAKLFSAPKDAIAAEIMPAAAKANPHIFTDKKSGQPKTVQQVIDTLYKKVGSKAEEFQAQVNSGKIGGGVPASISGAEPQPMLASAAPAPAPAAVAPKPVPSKAGAEATQQSKQYASNQMVAQATPTTPVVVNNNAGAAQPVQAPKQPLPKASSRPSDNSFQRALAKDFSHPTSFTSVAPV